MTDKIIEVKGMKCLIKFPANVKYSKKYPIIFFLHGAGSRNNTIEVLKTNDIYIHMKKDDRFVLVMPYCCHGTWYEKTDKLIELVDLICREKWSDEERIYLMGNSMGGYGAWHLAMTVPQKFATVIPICGGGMCWNAEQLINLPIWAFHGELDNTVDVKESLDMVNAVNNFGGNAKLTIYPDLEHNSWSRTIDNPEIYQWMLNNVKKIRKETKS